MMPTETPDPVRAIRSSVAVSALEHISCVRLEGDDAWDAADRLFTRELYLRDGQLSQGLVLAEDGTVWADAYLGSDEEDFIFLVEGPDSAGLEAVLREVSGDLEDLEIRDDSADHAIVAMDGPYAWELMAALAGPEVIGLPYLTFFRLDGRLCYRAGKTGEYGYRILVPADEVASTVSELQALGEELDVAQAHRAALDQCALENWFFNIRAEGARELSPLELQLQWRVSYDKRFRGSDALARRRAQGIRRRLTAVVGLESFTPGDPVRDGDHGIGEVVSAGYSGVMGRWVGLALLDLDYAHPHIPGLSAGDEPVALATARPPLLNNRSLYVNPQLQSYATRQDDDFPPVWTP